VWSQWTPSKKRSDAFSQRATERRRSRRGSKPHHTCRGRRAPTKRGTSNLTQRPRQWPRRPASAVGHPRGHATTAPQRTSGRGTHGARQSKTRCGRHDPRDRRGGDRPTRPTTSLYAPSPRQSKEAGTNPFFPPLPMHAHPPRSPLLPPPPPASRHPRAPPRPPPPRPPQRPRRPPRRPLRPQRRPLPPPPPPPPPPWP